MIKKGYKLLSLNSRISFFSRDVKFYEYVFLYKMASKYDNGYMFPDSSFVDNTNQWDPFPMMR